MRGYKGMTKDMTCRGMQFEIGKTNHVEGELKLCENGLHYCKELMDVFCYYNREGGNRFFEVEASDDAITDGRKFVASSITILRELSQIEINRSIYGNGVGHGFEHGNGDGFGCFNRDGYGEGWGNHGNGFGNGDGRMNGDGYGSGGGYYDGNGVGSGHVYVSDGTHIIGKNICKILVFNN